MTGHNQGSTYMVEFKAVSRADNVDRSHGYFSRTEWLGKVRVLNRARGSAQIIVVSLLVWHRFDKVVAVHVLLPDVVVKNFYIPVTSRLHPGLYAK